MWTAIVNTFLTVLLYIYSLIGNFGIAIIIFTVLVKLLMHPLMSSQIKSSKAMADLQTDPEYLEIQEKYKNNKDKLAEEQMKLYKEKNINMSASCLPLLIQFPIIIALYQAIINAIVSTPLGLIDLIKRVNTSLIPVQNIFPIDPNFLWMNLGQPDQIDIGLPINLPIMAILVAATSFLQTKLTTPPSSNNGSDSAGQMSKMMGIYMPLLMGWLSYSYSSGLSLYFLVSNLFTMAQYAFLGKLNLGNLTGKKQPTPAPTKAKAARKQIAAEKAAEKNEDVAPEAASAPEVKKDKPVEKSEPQEVIDFSKVDYREFKNKKKPKKNKQG